MTALHNDRIVPWLEFPVGFPLLKVQRRVMRPRREAYLIFACTDKARKMALALRIWLGCADEEPTSSPETESQVSAREPNNTGSEEPSFALSVLLLLHGGKNVVWCLQECYLIF